VFFKTRFFFRNLNFDLHFYFSFVLFRFSYHLLLFFPCNLFIFERCLLSLFGDGYCLEYSSYAVALISDSFFVLKKNAIDKITHNFFTVRYHICSLLSITIVLKYYRGADKPLARPGRKQANVSLRMV